MARLLLINHAAEVGGAEIGLMDIARHYGPQRCHVVLFEDGPLRGRLDNLGIGVTVLQAGESMMGVRRDAGRLRALSAVPAMLRLGLRLARIAKDFDILYPNTQKAAVVTMLMAPLIRRPIVWHLHDILSPEHFGAIQRRVVVGLANRAATKVIAISEVCKQSFLDCGGDPRLVEVVLNGIDVDRFIGIETLDTAAMRESMGLAGKPLVGLFGRITPWKGQHVLIAALAELPDVHVLMVGDALFGEIEYKESLRRQAEALGVTNRIHWLGFRKDVPQLMRMVDIVVHTSTSPEPFGRVIVEGALAGRPVLASSHGASAELLGDHSAWLVHPDDPAALARAIRDTLASPREQVAAAVEANRARALRLFALPAMMQGIETAVGLPA